MATPTSPRHIKIISWNVKGLGTPEKRSSILREVRRLSADVLFAQETHFKNVSIPKFHNRDYPTHIHHGSTDSKSRGVSILLHRSLHWQQQAEWRDEEGRALMVKGLLEGHMCTLATVYAPNSAQLTFLERWLAQLHSFSEGTLLFGGDFNMTLDPSLDTSKSLTTPWPYTMLRRLKRCLRQYQLVDIWRILHPKEKDYSFFSHPHQSYSRIDWFLMAHSDIPKVRDASIGHISLSDHAPILLEVELSTDATRSWTWRLNDSLLQDPLTLADIQAELKSFFEINTTPDSNPIMVWEAHKAYIRGILIKHGSRTKKARLATIQDTVDNISRIEALHKHSQASASLAELTALRERLKTLYMYKVKAQAARCKSTFFHQANKCGKLLARALKDQRAKTYITDIVDKKGHRQHISSEIAETFRTYYSSLYNLRATDPSHAEHKRSILTYLDRADLPQIPADWVPTLDAPITEREFQDAVRQAKTGKAPGPDGYSIAYYKSLQPILTLPFLEAFNHVREDATLPPDSLRAHITLIAKEGKDPTLCPSYRPISLLNTDLKLFSKILATRIAPLLPDLIHPDQVGFILGREARDNTTRVLNITHWIHKRGTPAVLLSADAEKAFDRVDWTFMTEVLRALGFGEGMLSWLKALYSIPSAQVRVNGLLSSRFSITNGTRQGCPLSPLLFDITLEPFLRIIRSERDIKGIRTGKSGEHKVAAYADDLLFLLSHPHTTTPNLLKEIRLFGEVSNFKINLQKSEALDFSFTPENRKALSQNFPFRWANSTISYLGTKIPKDPALTFSANFPPLLHSMSQDIAKWQLGLYSWIGRCNIIKMTLLPKLLYLFQALPIKTPRSFLKKIMALWRRFLWMGKPPRLASTLLSLPKQRGGIAMPDVFKYHTAVHLTRVIDWCRNANSKQWIALEQDCSPIPLSTLPWCAREIPMTVKTHLTIGATLDICKTTFANTKLSPTWSPLFPLSGNPEFPPGLLDPAFGPRLTGEHLRAHHLGTHTQWPSTLEMQTHPVLQNLPFWKQVQLAHFLRSLPERAQFQRPLTRFEQMCSETGPIRHVVAAVYATLSQPDPEFRPQFIKEWEKDLGKTWSPKQTQRIIQRSHSSSHCVRYQELSYKILSRWYRTPQKLHQLFPEASDLCWRCGQAPGTLLHIFWDCQGLGTFWTDVGGMVRRFTDLDISVDPATFLLHLTPSSTKGYRKSVLPHLLNAAKSLIPALWKSTTPPTLRMWILKVNEIYRMEDLWASATGTQAVSARKWFFWHQFCATPEYSAILDPDLLT